MLRIPRLVPLLPIGMKFVKVKEATSSHAVAARSYWNTLPKSIEDLPPRLTGRTCTCDFNASFNYKRAKLFQLVQSYAD
jgi:hypothetical protein